MEPKLYIPHHIYNHRYYTAPTPYGSLVALRLLDNDTITCDVDWATENIVTQNIYLTVRDGPVFDYENPAYTGDPKRPVWQSEQKALYNDTATDPYRIIDDVSLSSFVDRNMSAYPHRVVGCTAVGIDQATSLPVTLSALSKVVLDVSALPTPSAVRKLVMNGAEPQTWSDFTYPIYTNYTKPCFALEGCISTSNSSSAGIGSALMANWAPDQLLLVSN